MLRLDAFELLMPETVEELVALYREHPGAILLAGGTDMVPKLKRFQFEPEIVISLERVSELQTITLEADRIRIGARATLRKLESQSELCAHGAIRESLRKIATPIIRSSGTIAGNILQDTRCRYYDRSAFWREAIGYCLKKDGDECRVAPGGGKCFATFCSDLVAALLVHDATVTLCGSSVREIALEDLYQDDGMDHLVLDNEVLTQVTVPLASRRSVYKKLRMRDAWDFPEAGVAAAVVPAVGSAQDSNQDSVPRPSFRPVAEHVVVAVTGIETHPIVFRSEGSLANLDREAFAARIYQSIKPVDTMFLPPAHRKRVVRNFVRQSLDELLPT